MAWAGCVVLVLAGVWCVGVGGLPDTNGLRIEGNNRGNGRGQASVDPPPLASCQGIKSLVPLLRRALDDLRTMQASYNSEKALKRARSHLKMRVRARQWARKLRRRLLRLCPRQNTVISPFSHTSGKLWASAAGGYLLKEAINDERPVRTLPLRRHKLSHLLDILANLFPRQEQTTTTATPSVVSAGPERRSDESVGLGNSIVEEVEKVGMDVENTVKAKEVETEVEKGEVDSNMEEAEERVISEVEAKVGMEEEQVEAEEDTAEVEKDEMESNIKEAEGNILSEGEVEEGKVGKESHSEEIQEDTTEEEGEGEVEEGVMEEEEEGEVEEGTMEEEEEGEVEEGTMEEEEEGEVEEDTLVEVEVEDNEDEEEKETEEMEEDESREDAEESFIVEAENSEGDENLEAESEVEVVEDEGEERNEKDEVKNEKDDDDDYDDDDEEEESILEAEDEQKNESEKEVKSNTTENFVEVEEDVMEVAVEVGVEELLREVPDTFLSLALSPRLMERGWLDFNTSSPRLLSLVGALAPAVLRVGGSAANFLTYDPTSSGRSRHHLEAEGGQRQHEEEGGGGRGGGDDEGLEAWEERISQHEEVEEGGEKTHQKRHEGWKDYWDEDDDDRSQEEGSGEEEENGMKEREGSEYNKNKGMTGKEGSGEEEEDMIITDGKGGEEGEWEINDEAQGSRGRREGVRSEEEINLREEEEESGRAQGSRGRREGVRSEEESSVREEEEEDGRAQGSRGRREDVRSEEENNAKENEREEEADKIQRNRGKEEDVSTEKESNTREKDEEEEGEKTQGSRGRNEDVGSKEESNAREKEEEEEDEREAGRCSSTTLPQSTFTNFTITREDWMQLLQFTQTVGMQLLFDLNQFYRGPEGDWDPSNARLLLRDACTSGSTSTIWQLGNEPNAYKHKFGIVLSGEQTARDYESLRKVLEEECPSPAPLVGPDVTRPKDHKKHHPQHGFRINSMDFLESFLAASTVNLAAVTWHQYYVNGHNATLEEFLDPAVMDQLVWQVAQVVQIRDQLAPGKPIWLTESGSAWGGGAEGLSDSFVAGFLWLDKLGVAAKGGVEVVARQTLYQACYALLSPDLTPNPDYWLSVLYKRLVGGRVLSLRMPSAPPTLRLYAHCLHPHAHAEESPEGGVVVLGMNLGIQSLRVSLGNKLAASPILQYLLQPADCDLKARQVLLNGEEVQLGPEGELPPLKHASLPPGPFTLPPTSLGYWVLPRARAPVCL